MAIGAIKLDPGYRERFAIRGWRYNGLSRRLQFRSREVEPISSRFRSSFDRRRHIRDRNGRVFSAYRSAAWHHGFFCCDKCFNRQRKYHSTVRDVVGGPRYTNRLRFFKMTTDNFPLSVVNAIVCEDIRTEVSNKYILIGVFGGQINLSVSPAVIQLALFLELSPNRVGPVDLEFKIGEGIKGTLHFEVADTETPFGTAVGPIPVPIVAPSDLHFEWRLPSGKWRLIRTLRIASAIAIPSIPTASPPPSSQSRRAARKSKT